MRAPILPICALVTLLAVAGCGGGSAKPTASKPTASEPAASKADVQRVVTDFATAVNARDGARICGKLTTQSYVERTTGARGQAAVTRCKAQIASLQPAGTYRVLKFVRTTIRGDSADVVADLATGPQRRRTTLHLVKQDGSFRLTSGTGG